MYNDKVNSMLSIILEGFFDTFIQSGIGGWSQKAVLKTVIK